MNCLFLFFLSSIPTYFTWRRITLLVLVDQTNSILHSSNVPTFFLFFTFRIPECVSRCDDHFMNFLVHSYTRMKALICMYKLDYNKIMFKFFRSLETLSVIHSSLSLRCGQANICSFCDRSSLTIFLICNTA